MMGIDLKEFIKVVRDLSRNEKESIYRLIKTYLNNKHAKESETVINIKLEGQWRVEPEGKVLYIRPKQEDGIGQGVGTGGDLAWRVGISHQAQW